MEEYLILFERFSPAFVKHELIPEIEKNCTELGIFSQTAYDIFQKNKYAANSLYFHHDYAVADIPIGQKYEAVAYSKNRKLQYSSIQKCPSKVLCFFTAYKPRPSDNAMRGHHELSLIQFCDGVPSIISELFERTDHKPLQLPEKYIYLGSEKELRRLVRKQEATEAAAQLLEELGIKNEADLQAQTEEKTSAIYEMLKKLAVEKYQLGEQYVKTLLYDGLLEIRMKKSH